MALPVPQRLTLIWLGLILATVMSVEYLSRLGLSGSANAARAAVLIVVLLKVRYVGLDFMELRSAPRFMRLAFEGWALLLVAAMIWLHWGR